MSNSDELETVKVKLKEIKTFEERVPVKELIRLAEALKECLKNGKQ